MANGFFLGGMAEGMANADERAMKERALTSDIGLRSRGLDIQQGQLDRQVNQDTLTHLDKLVAENMSLISETVKSLRDSGSDPASIQKVVGPLAESLAPIWQKAGRDPASLNGQISAMISQPPAPPTFGQVGGDPFGGSRYGFINPRTQTVAVPKIQGTPDIGTTTPDMGSKIFGDEFLKTSVPPELHDIVKKIASYDMDPRTSTSLRGGQREKILAMVAQYDPTYDQALYPSRAAAIKEFNAGGPNSPAGMITAGNTAIKHLLQVSDAAQKLGGVDNAWILNMPINKLHIAKEAMKNNPALKEYDGAVGKYVEEATKFYRGIGGNEADIQRDLENLTAAQSPTARNAALATQAALMKSKIEALQSRWQTAMGPTAWQRSISAGDFPIIQKDSAKALITLTARAGNGAKIPGIVDTLGTPSAQPGMTPLKMKTPSGLDFEIVK